MKSMNRSSNRRLPQPAAPHSAGSQLRELTHQETAAVSGGLGPLAFAVIMFAAEQLLAASNHNGTPLESGSGDFTQWTHPGHKF